MIEIPLLPDPFQVFNIVLDGQECTITLEARMNSLFLTLEVGNEIVVQNAICNGLSNIITVSNSVFRGSLHFYDTLGETPPIWERLGERYLLYYVSADDEIQPTALTV